MEERLKIRSKFRFPFYKQLMWHTAAHYLTHLRSTRSVTVEEAHSSVSKLEKEGLVSLCACLQTWLRQSKDGSDLPSIRENPTKLLKELEKILRREGIVGPPVVSRSTATPQLMLRPLSAERPVSQWPTLGEGEASDEERAPEDTDDGEIDPSDEEDIDYFVGTITSRWSKRERTSAVTRRAPSATKILGRKAVAVSRPAKRHVVFALPRIPTTLPPSKIKKSNHSVRGRLLKNCSLDPEIPTPKVRLKEYR